MNILNWSEINTNERWKKKKWSGLQLSAILTEDIKIELSLEIRDDITVWHKVQFNAVFYFCWASLLVCVYVHMHFVPLICVLQQ